MDVINKGMFLYKDKEWLWRKKKPKLQNTDCHSQSLKSAQNNQISNPATASRRPGCQ